MCVDGYFEQFGVCVQCPPSSGASAGEVVGIVLLLFVLGFIFFKVRMLLPVDVLKLGLSMLQVRTYLGAFQRWRAHCWLLRLSCARAGLTFEHTRLPTLVHML